LDAVFAIAPRHLVDLDALGKRQKIDETPTSLAKKLTLELQI
jgi:hypothetical protein